MKRIIFSFSKFNVAIKFLLLGVILTQQEVYSQDSLNTEPTGFKITGFVDAYYGNTFKKVAGSQLPYYTSSSNLNNVNINLAYIYFEYENERVRSKFMPAFGNVMQNNASGEPNALAHLMEGYVGFKPFPKKNIWLDMGVFLSSYTPENAISRDQLTYTRSTGTEFVPYYVSGARAVVPLGKKITWTLWAINGYQQIYDVNNNIAYQNQIEYRPTPELSINNNIYIGNEINKNSSLGLDYRNRYYTDFYVYYNPNEKWNFTSVFYVGIQERVKTYRDVGTVDKLENPVYFNANVVARYNMTEKHSVSGRLEHFSDRHHIYTSQNSLGIGFQTSSATLSYCNKVSPNTLLRFEVRQFFAPEKVFFLQDGKEDNKITWGLVSLAHTFGR